MFQGGGPSKRASWLYALSQSITSFAMSSNLPRHFPAMDRLVGVHVLAVQPQHLGQRRGPGQPGSLQPAHGRYPPGRTVASGTGSAFDHAEQPVAHLGGDTPTIQPMMRHRQQLADHQILDAESV